MDECTIPGTLKTLQLALAERDWLKGIVLSAAYLETYGLWKIKELLTVNGHELYDESLEKLNFNQILMLLRALRLIDNKTSRNMQRLKRLRNRLIKKNIYFPILHEKILADRYLLLVEDTIFTLRNWGIT